MEQDGLSKLKAEIKALSYTDMMEFAREMDILIGGVVRVLEMKGSSCAPLEPAPAIAAALHSWVMDDAEQVVKSLKRDYWRNDSILHPDPAKSLKPLIPISCTSEKEFSKNQSNADARSSTGNVLVSLAEIKKMGIPFSRPHIYDLMNQGRFPRPVKIGSRKNAWVKAEIERWIIERASERKN